jgi:hypothetical protein
MMVGVLYLISYLIFQVLYNELVALAKTEDEDIQCYVLYFRYIQKARLAHRLTYVPGTYLVQYVHFIITRYLVQYFKLDYY